MSNLSSPKGRSPDEDHRVKAEALFREARGSKDAFMTAVKAGGWDRGLAEVFGTSQREEFDDAASTWWGRRQKLAQGPVVTVQPMKLSEGGLVKNMRVEEILDPLHERDATLYIHPSTNVGDQDLANIRLAVVSHDFVDGITSDIPLTIPKFFPWQRTLAKRALYVLPLGFHDLDEAPYVYYGKGLKFDRRQKREFDLLEVRRQILGEEIPAESVRTDISFDRRGVLSFLKRPMEVNMGQDYEKSEHEYSMMLLARQRGLTTMVDEPIAYGRFKTRPEAGASQGFIFTRQEDQGQRGDMEIYSMDNNYLGRLLVKSGALKNEIISEFVKNVDGFIREFVDSGRFVDENGGVVLLQDMPPLRAVLGRLKTDASDLSSSDDPQALANLPHMITIAETLGVAGVSFKKLLRQTGDGIIDHWRGDVETIHVGQGIAVSEMFDRGLSHEQPHLGNLRYRRTGNRQRSVVVCDWHDGQDLTKMTYPQALGYVANSMRTLLDSSRQTEQHDLISMVGPSALRKMLEGLTKNVEGDIDGLIDDVVEAARTTEPSEIRRKALQKFGWTTKGYLRSYCDAPFHEATKRPITGINHPLVQLAKIIYPPEKHEALRREYGGGDESL